MKSIYVFVWGVLGLILGIPTLEAASLEMKSPDGRLTVVLETSPQLVLILSDEQRCLTRIEGLALETDRGMIPSAEARIKKIRRNEQRDTLVPVIREKQSLIPERYNEGVVVFNKGYSLEIRLYDEGLAYRWVTDWPGEMIVKQEHAAFRIDTSAVLTFQKDARSGSDYEAPYVTKTIGSLTEEDMGNLPALVALPDSKRLLFLESDVRDYPVMWLKTRQGVLNIHQWNYPEAYRNDGNPYRKRDVTATRDYIARVEAARTFPWRVVAVADRDIDLMNNQLVWLLGPECRIEDPSWIEPGWVMLDWWAKYGIYGVDFKAGINTSTLKYMIDFAARYGLQYVLLDDGWTRDNDLTKMTPEVDIEEVVAYGRQKNVGILLWVTYSLFEEQMDRALDQFERWGIRGLKIDFMNRDDQLITNFYWKAAEQTAKHHMLLNFHGAYKPDGLRRAYPNVLTREALIEFEYNGGTDRVSPDHDCTLPFIRNVAGPMDYLPGTMNNASRQDFRPVGRRPMGQGTRAHTMALAVVFESPMQMVPDAPPAYMREDECARFLFDIPITWDETRPLDGRVGDYVAVARRQGQEWFLGAITDWQPRTLALSLDFLEEGQTYQIELFRDGPNASVMAVDYVKETRSVTRGETLSLDMASGGGWVARIRPLTEP